MNNRFYTHYEAVFNNQAVNTDLERSLYTKLFQKHNVSTSRYNFLSLLSMKKIISLSAGLAGAGVAVAVGIALLYPSQSVTAEDILKHAGQLISPQIAAGEIYTATRTVTEEQTSVGKTTTTTQKETYVIDEAGNVRMETRNEANQLMTAVLYRSNGKNHGYGYDMYRLGNDPSVVLTPEQYSTIMHGENTSSSIWEDASIPEADKQAVGMTGDSPKELVFGDSMLRKWASGALDKTAKFFNEPVLVGEETLNGKVVYKIVHKQGDEFTDTVWIEKESNRLVREETETFFDQKSNDALLIVPLLGQNPSADAEKFIPSEHTKRVITYNYSTITKNIDTTTFELDGWKKMYGAEQAAINEEQNTIFPGDMIVIPGDNTNIEKNGCGGTLSAGDYCAPPTPLP